MKFDYLIVGSGLFGSTCAHELLKAGKSVRVIEKRHHVGGNVYTRNEQGIQVHQYGAHIFHTNSREIWEYVNGFVEFNRFTNSPLARYQEKLYNLPFNMNTFYQLWGVTTPAEAKKIIEDQKGEFSNLRPRNLEEQAISLVGRDVYEKLIRGYTEKQWGRSCKDLPAFIIKRIPVRFTFDNNYFSDNYQGIPKGGYTQLIEKMLEGVDVELGIDYLKEKDKLRLQAERVLYTGPVDAYFGYCYGSLNYRSLRFDEEIVNIADVQGNAVVNYTDSKVPYTRIIEHKHFDPVDVPVSVVTKEYPCEWSLGDEPYYPVNDDLNNELYVKYRELSKLEEGVYFGGRLAEYKYYDMHQVIASALKLVRRELLIND